MPLPAEHRRDGLMARATETDEIFQGLVAEVVIRLMMHLGRHMLKPQLTAVAVALKDQATFLAPGVTAQIAEIGDLHGNPLLCLAWRGSPRPRRVSLTWGGMDHDAIARTKSAS
jgi:hypothetical protein